MSIEVKDIIDFEKLKNLTPKEAEAFKLKMEDFRKALQKKTREFLEEELSEHDMAMLAIEGINISCDDKLGLKDELIELVLAVKPSNKHEDNIIKTDKLIKEIEQKIIEMCTKSPDTNIIQHLSNIIVAAFGANLEKKINLAMEKQ